MTSARIVATVCALFFLLSGCFSTGGSGRMVDFYTLEYTPPAFESPGAGEIVKFDRFFSARFYDSTAMLYKPDAYRLEAYNYHKWRTTPGDMVTDYLVRDFRQSGLFRAVFSYRQPEPARFVVGGGIDEFVEAKEVDRWNAVLGLHVTLLDMKQSDVTEQIVFQKRYRVTQPISGESPDSFATGMSAAMARTSADIIRDVNSAIKGRSNQKP